MSDSLFYDSDEEFHLIVHLWICGFLCGDVEA